ncbi:MAG TPA: SpoIIE family protein phosphatase [Solirubrobacteraceae bacterium]|nr:SpoIIE family protein phosphatase [Solirubrobacteraceae bacterium]
MSAAPRRDTAILLVDDHDENLLALEAILEPTGYRLVRAGSGDEALRALLRDEFAAILLDVQMPGIDGFETATLIRARERTRGVPIIFVTAISTSEAHVFRGYDAGAVDYLFKPVDPVVLRSKVEVFGELYERGRALAEREELLRAMFEDAPIGMARADADGRLRHVNGALVETLGRNDSELVGRTLDELGPAADAGIDDAQREHLLSGQTRHYEVERRLTGPRGTTIPVLVSISLARSTGGGRPDLILQLQDLRERRRAQRDHEQLIRAESARAHAEVAAERLQIMQSIATAALGAEGLEDLLRELLDRILEALDADRASAVLTDEARAVVARAAGGVDTIVQREPQGAVDELVERVTAERGPVTIADVPAAGIDASSLGPAISSLLAMPLYDGERVIGSIQVGTLTRRDFDAETVGLLRLAADRAGLAIARTRLYERERRIAQELQRSLLPKRLPDVAGVTLGARYEPGENGTAVGGDWYDAVALPSGRIAVAIGDVVGRGIAAAATMGQMRSALRAILMQADDTGTMADRLNRFTLALGSDEAIMTTVVLAILEPGAQRLHFTNAGHPPPLLIRPDGSSAYLDERPAPPMGVLPTPRYEQHTTAFEPGSTLALYTDGLVEEPSEVLDVGLARLRDAAQSAGTDVDSTCELLLASQPNPDAARSDDVTLLVVRLQETLGERISLEVGNESGGLYAMRQMLRRWLGEHAATSEETEDIIMACNEACENAVEHSYGMGSDLFDVELSHTDGDVAVCVRDRGGWLEPRERPDRGRGLSLMRAMMDAVDIQPRAGGTTVLMRRRLAAAASAAGAPRPPAR